MSNPWFRLYSEFMHDPKVQMLSEQDQRRLVMILCMRCNSDVTLQDKHVTFTLRISDQEWEQTKACFVASGFIDTDNNVLNWDKRQFISDSSAARVAKHRALHKRVTVTQSNVTVTPPEQNRTEQKQTQKQSRTDTENTGAAAPKKNAMTMLSELGVETQTAEDWLTVRKAKRAPLTVTALKDLVREAGKAGITVNEAVAICARKAWQSFNASWDWKGVGRSHQTPDERRMASTDKAIEEWLGESNTIEGECHDRS